MSVEWKDLVSEVREMAKEAEDFTNRLYTLTSAIQRMGRDEVRESTERMKETHQASLERLGNERESGTCILTRPGTRNPQEEE